MASGQEGLSPRTRAFYAHMMTVLAEAGVPVMVGGAYALTPVTGIERHTKDLDLFLKPADRDRALGALEAAGCRVELTYPHWLAKAYDPEASDERFIDLIYRSGNGVSEVDDEWFAHAVEADVLGVSTRLSPVEESLWTKAFIMERERFDGADIAHLISACGDQLNWKLLLYRFGADWRVLLAHLTLFGYIFPSQRDPVPRAVMEVLRRRLERELAASPPDEKVCQGTLLSRGQYLVDVEERGFVDGRLRPDIDMTEEDIAHWTACIPEEERPTQRLLKDDETAG